MKVKTKDFKSVIKAVDTLLKNYGVSFKDRRIARNILKLLEKERIKFSKVLFLGDSGTVKLRYEKGSNLVVMYQFERTVIEIPRREGEVC